GRAGGAGRRTGRRRHRRLHPQPAGGRTGVVAAARTRRRRQQPLPQPDRAGVAQTVRRDPPADREGPADLRGGPVREGRDPRAEARERRHRRGARRSGPDRAPEAGAPGHLPVIQAGERLLTADEGVLIMAVDLPTTADARKARRNPANAPAERAQAARPPLPAVLGAADRGVSAEPQAVEGVQHRVAELPQHLNGEELRKAVAELKEQAERTYVGFAKQGEQTWSRIRTRPEVKE